MNIALVAAPLSASPPKGYVELLQSYCDGDVDGSVSGTVSLSLKEIRRLAKEVSSKSLPLSADESKAATLLHTQAGIVSEGRGENERRDAHLSLAQTIAQTLGDGDFQRNWFRALGYYYQNTLDEGKAVEVFERLTKQYPESAAGWLGWGTVLESAACIGIGTSSRVAMLSSPWRGEEVEVELRTTKRNMRRRGLHLAKLSRTRALYREAASREPRSGEIQLRLGRTSELLGEEHVAREHYAWVIANGTEPFHKAMARLFIGRMLERGGAIDAAIAQYAEAMVEDPSLQLTYLALSHALQVAGRRHESKVIMMSALRLGELEPDPKVGRNRYLIRTDAFVDGILSLQSELIR